jgi:site-specific recombinase XerD
MVLTYLYTFNRTIMAKIQFTLNRGLRFNENEEQSIYIRVTFGRKADFTASLRYKVLPDDWCFVKQRIKDRGHINNRKAVNQRLSQWQEDFEAYDVECDLKKKIPTTTDLRNYFKEKSAKQVEVKQTMTLLRYFDEFMKTAHLRMNRGTKTKVSPSTIKGYRTSINKIKSFIKKKRPHSDFDSINLNFYLDFVEFCEGEGLTLNYIGKHIKTLKIVLNESVRLGYTNNLEFREERFAVVSEEVDEVYLDTVELNKIWSLDLSEHPRHERARDLFLIGCFTGLRVSDYNYLNATHIHTVQDVEMISIKTKKMKKKVSIPMSSVIKQIFSKNDGNPPKRLPDQHINYLIKEVCEWVGIDNKVEATHTRGGKQVTIIKHKFEMVKTHTARRSFCTNMYLNGVEVVDIMSLSGHQTFKNFMTYLKVGPEQTAIRLSKNSYFNNGLSVA